jgi:hypothetical protein
MSKSQFIQLTGWAFILGAFGFITILVNSIVFAGSIISSILLAVGLLGLRARYGDRAGSFGKSMLLFGMLGPVLWVIVIASMALMYGSRNLTDTQVEKGLWILLFGGPAITLLGLTLFGLSTLVSRPMARLNWLPLFAGIWYPVFYFFLAGYLFTHDGVYPEQYQFAFTIMHSIQFFALLALGVALNDTSQELATA